MLLHEGHRVNGRHRTGREPLDTRRPPWLGKLDPCAPDIGLSTCALLGTLRTGRIIRAEQYGKRAFALWVRDGSMQPATAVAVSPAGVGATRDCAVIDGARFVPTPKPASAGAALVACARPAQACGSL